MLQFNKRINIIQLNNKKNNLDIYKLGYLQVCAKVLGSGLLCKDFSNTPLPILNIQQSLYIYQHA